jgi:glutamate 5-kinase
MRIVLKFGSGILTKKDSVEPNPIQLRKLMEAVVLLKEAGHQCVVVSSGAVASGLRPLNFQARPDKNDNPTLQACAAIGQAQLMSAYESLLRDHGLHVAQLLITHEDLTTPTRAACVTATLKRLLEFSQIVPIINENDSVATEELHLGDNDQLSSMVALLWQADVLLLLTSAAGLMLDPEDKQAAPVALVEDVKAVRHLVQAKRTAVGSGGMDTKLDAAEAAVNGGIDCIIADGRVPEAIPEIIAGGGVCTRFPAKK